MPSDMIHLRSDHSGADMNQVTIDTYGKEGSVFSQVGSPLMMNGLAPDTLSALYGVIIKSDAIHEDSVKLLAIREMSKTGFFRRSSIMQMLSVLSQVELDDDDTVGDGTTLSLVNAGMAALVLDLRRQCRLQPDVLVILQNESLVDSTKDLLSLDKYGAGGDYYQRVLLSEMDMDWWNEAADFYVVQDVQNIGMEEVRMLIDNYEDSVFILQRETSTESEVQEAGSIEDYVPEDLQDRITARYVIKCELEGTRIDTLLYIP